MLAEILLTGLFGVAFYMIMDQWRLLKDPVVVMVKDTRDPKPAEEPQEKKESKDEKTQPKRSERSDSISFRRDDKWDE